MKLSRHNSEEDGGDLSAMRIQGDRHNADWTRIIENVNTLYIYLYIHIHFIFLNVIYTCNI